MPMRNRPDKYKLIGRLAVPVDDLLAWAAWLETADRIVAKGDVGPLRVSTVFLGLDHNYAPDGDPLLFETMVFGGSALHESDEIYCDRCSTWGEAERMHSKAVAWARERLAQAEAALQRTGNNAC